MASTSVPAFVRGQVYNRRKDIHLPFGGSHQSGISPSRRYPFVFLFTGKGGEQHGYEDSWENGVFLYSGEGQKGNQSFKAGNKAIRDHARDGRDLLLFTNVKNGVRFEGIFHYAGHHIRSAPGGDKKLRELIVFHLISDELPEDAISFESIPDITHATLDELRKAAYAASAPPTKILQSKESARFHYKRSEEIRLYVLKRANGVCESCGGDAPFLRKDGSPYLENHHIHKISENGRDDPAHVAAICPTCHRLIHHGKNGAATDDSLLEKILKKELALQVSR